MTQLSDITEIADLEIKSLEEIARESGKPAVYKPWFAIQERLRQEGKAPSLSAYLLYEYQFRGKDSNDFAEEFGVKQNVIVNMLNRMGIPLRTVSENKKGKNKVSDEQIKQLADLVRDEMRMYNEGEIGRLSENAELGELVGGASYTSLVKYLRKYMSNEELKFRKDIVNHQHRALSPRDQRALVELVREEISAFKLGRIPCISTEMELAESFGISSETLFRYLSKSLTEEEREYRSSAIHNQIRPQDREALIGLVQWELEGYREGRIKNLTNNAEFGEMLGVRNRTVAYQLRALSKEDKKLRNAAIREQIGRNMGVKGSVKSKARKKRRANEVLKIISEEIKSHRDGKLQRFTTTAELSELTGYSATQIGRYISSGLSDEDSLYRESAIQSSTMTARNETYGLPEFVATPQRIEKLSQACRKRNRIHGNPLDNLTLAERRINYRKGLGKITYEERVEIAKKTHRTLAQRYTPEEIFKMRGKGGKKAGKKAIELLRKKYFVEERFYSQSQQEGAVALMLEKYVLGYEISDGVNFQVKDRKIDNGGIDFLVNEEFLEWHPIVLGGESFGGKNRRGDIPDSDRESYFKVLKQLEQSERSLFRQDYARVLALDYKQRRQQAVDNSEYSGARLFLVTDERTLYDFISRYSSALPEFKDFRREFKEKIKYVKGFVVEKQEVVGAA